MFPIDFIIGLCDKYFPIQKHIIGSYYETPLYWKRNQKSDHLIAHGQVLFWSAKKEETSWLVCLSGKSSICKVYLYIFLCTNRRKLIIVYWGYKIDRNLSSFSFLFDCQFKLTWFYFRLMAIHSSQWSLLSSRICNFE